MSPCIDSAFMLFILLSIVVLDVLAEVKREAGRGNQHCGPVAFGIDGMVALGIRKAPRGQEGVGLVEVIHVHADERHVLRPAVDLGDVNVEAVFVLHANAVEVLLTGVCLDVVPPFKAQRLEQFDDGLRVPGNDKRVEACDLHSDFSFQNGYINAGIRGYIFKMSVCPAFLSAQIRKTVSRQVILPEPVSFGFSFFSPFLSSTRKIRIRRRSPTK